MTDDTQKLLMLLSIMLGPFVLMAIGAALMLRGDIDARIARWSEKIAAYDAEIEADRVLGAAKRAAIYARYEEKRKSLQPPKFLAKAIAWLEKKEAEARAKHHA